MTLSPLLCPSGDPLQDVLERFADGAVLATLALYLLVTIVQACSSASSVRLFFARGDLS